jgi:hypothetical protein
MSTKTNFKRVALVAVAALGLGVLTSVAPANADATGITFQANGTNSAALQCAISNTTGTATVLSAGTMSIAIGGTAATTDAIKVTGPLYISAISGGSVSASLVSATPSAAGSLYATVKATGTGSGTISVYNGNSMIQTLNVTVVGSCSSGVTAAKSYVQVNDTAGNYVYTAADLAETTPTATAWSSAQELDTSVDQMSTFVNAATAYLKVAPLDVYGADVTTGYITVTATNGALVNGIAGGATAAVTHSYQNSFSVSQPTPGAPLSTTLTVSHNGVVLATKSITITGDASKLTASYVYSGASGQSTTTGTTNAQGRIGYKIYDSANNLLTNSSSLYPVALYASSNEALVNQAAQASGKYINWDGAGASARMFHNCIDATKSGSATLTLYTANKAGAVLTATVGVTCSGTTATYSASFDKASYNIGDIATLTIKGTDANGKPVADQTTLGNGSTSTVAVPGMTAVAAPVSTDASYGGVWEYTYTVGTTANAYTAAVTIGGALVQTTAATASYKIVDGSGGVSNADVLKAIVSLIASINKQIAALQKALLKR